MTLSDGDELRALHSWRSAICDSALDPPTRHVALTLALYMNERGGSAFPGAPRLAHDTGYHEVTVRTKLTVLVTEGWLRITERGGQAGKRRRANAYQATFPDARPAPPLAEDNGSSSATGSGGLQPPLAEGCTTPSGGLGHLSIELPMGSTPYTPSLFDRFWALYPRKVGKRTALAAFKRALKRATTPDAILAGAGRTASSVERGADPQYVPHPTSWLNRDGWLDVDVYPRRDAPPGWGVTADTVRSMKGESSDD